MDKIDNLALPQHHSPSKAQLAHPRVLGINRLQNYVHAFGQSVTNAFDVDAWKRATTLNWLSVRLVVESGSVEIALRQHDGDGTTTDIEVLSRSGTGLVISQPLMLRNLSGALMPEILSASADAHFDIIFTTDDAPSNPKTHINYIFCTFNRSDYVKKNSEVFRRYVKHYHARARTHLTIVDNGAGDPEQACGVLADQDVTVLANSNTGGTGGFGRGMFESCFGALSDKDFTHVCLLDDDIYLEEEMFARNTAFIQYLKPGYHVGAPMYPTSSANKKPGRSACFGHKYRGSVHPSDQALGAGLETQKVHDFVRMDRAPDSTGWWWDCIATSDIRKVGLPYPFFIKMDDLSYSLRLKEAGVELVIPFSFWVLHDDFDEKYSAAMQYFRFRNRWILLAQQDRIKDVEAFVHSVYALVKDFIYARKYEHAELLLNAMDHFMNGPERLLLDEKLILKNVFKVVQREKNGPMPGIPNGSQVVNGLYPPATERTQLLNRLTYNNHFVPLRENVTVNICERSTPTDCRRGKVVHYWNAEKSVGFTVERKSIRAARQFLRLRGQSRRLRKVLPDLIKTYQAAIDFYTARNFWENYGALEGLAKQQRATTTWYSATASEAPTGPDSPFDQLAPEDLAVFNSLRNRYQGKRCFVLGNGPSLTVSDLNLLKNEVTFAANKIYLCFNETTWRPTFYSVEDRLVAKNNAAEISAIDGTTKIFPHHMLEFLPRQANHHYTRWLPPINNRSPFREFSTDLTKGICWGSTITYSMIQMAVHMGFREIYILGLDHSYVEPKSKKDGALVSEGERNHFHPDYRKPGEMWH